MSIILHSFAISLMLASAAFAQNYSVVTWSTMPTNAPERLLGIPANWPISTQTHPIGTNTSVTPPAVLMTKAQLMNMVATNQAAYDAYLVAAKAAEEAPKLANIQAAKNLYGQIPAALAELQVYKQAWDNGTNFTAAQLQVWARKNNEATIGLLKLFQQLGPILVDQYKGE